MPEQSILDGVTIAVLNLPHPERLIRRYMCTYKSPYFCVPPHDLLQVASCIASWTKAHVVFLDAIAQNLDPDAVRQFLRRHNPQFLVTLLGVESLSTDVECASSLKETVPGMRLIFFGYYATQYPQKILVNGTADAVLRGDAEASICEVLSALHKDTPLGEIHGVAYRLPDGSPESGSIRYLSDLDALPKPDYGMVKPKLYNEMLLGGPFGAIQTSRGCPYACRYCTSSHERTLLVRDPVRVVDELQALHVSGIRVVRFLDDTFTVDRQRVIAICKEILNRNLRVRWSCLARVDTLEAEMLSWMKKAGCVRIVVGIESYAPNVLEVFRKRTEPSEINSRLQLINDAGIESVGFIIVGGPFETDDDFEITRKGLLESPLDLAIIDTIAVYGDTDLMRMYQDQIEFHLFPYISRWRDPQINAVALKRAQILYRQFYLRPRGMFRQILNFLRFPARSLRILFLLLRFVVTVGKPSDRQDLF